MTVRGFGITGAMDPQIVRELAPVLEELGYQTLWVNDIPGGDSLQRISVAASVTTRLRLASGVIPLDRVPPSEIARNVERLGIPHDRLVLGIGSGGASQALSTVRHAVEDVRSLLGPDVKIVIGALGPKMIELASEIGDGVLLNWLTPEAARLSRQAVFDAASRAGHIRPEIIAYVRVAIGAQAGARLSVEAERYGTFPSYAAHFARHGVSAIDTTINADHASEIRSRLGAFDGAVDEVVVRAITAEESLEHYSELALVAAQALAGSPLHESVGRDG